MYHETKRCSCPKHLTTRRRHTHIIYKGGQMDPVCYGETSYALELAWRKAIENGTLSHAIVVQTCAESVDKPGTC